MDVNLKGVESDANGKILSSLECPKAVLNGVECDGDDETQTLLTSKKCEKPRRKVQWLDRNGSKLAEIFVFQPRNSDRNLFRIGQQLAKVQQFARTSDCFSIEFGQSFGRDLAPQAAEFLKK